MRKKELAKEVIERLKKEYPDAGCSLEYDQAWKLLVSVRLAAQCTDARVNIVVEKLYEKFPDVKALAEAPVEEIEEIVRPCGLGKSKAIADSHPNIFWIKLSFTWISFKTVPAPIPFTHWIAVNLPTFLAGLYAENNTMQNENTPANKYVHTDI